MRERSAHQAEVQRYDAQVAALEDARVLLGLARDESDDATASEVQELARGIEAQLGEMEFARMFAGEADRLDAIVAINSGAGGTESQDWAEMLMRMYRRYSERRGFQTELVEVLPGEEAGVKNATMTVSGEYAYGYLKAEAGVHRLVRISPFDAQKRRHTSFASVFVYPDVEDNIEVDVREDDLRVDTYRSGGAGGQHVNKTESAVRITHLPTGIVVTCQNERSQHKNRSTAMKILRSRLYELELRKRQEELDAVHAQKKEIAWGSQIRSYVLQPYQMVKDHRTGVETSNVDAVLDGDLADFIKAWLLCGGATTSPSGDA
jgi:peptide chain release factor 2